MQAFCDLWTARGRAVTDTPWQEYPRPALRRDSYLNLNGLWDFAAAAEPPTSFDRTIRVPFPPESLLSGIHEVFPEETPLWYRRSFRLPEGFVRGRVLLHFGAVDQIAEVWVNGAAVGRHTGGYFPFTLDITDCLQDENTLLVRVEDHLSNNVLPYGKQKHERGGIWYTPVSGIWQTVWLESVPEAHIRAVRIDAAPERVRFAVEGASDGLLRIRTPENERIELPFADGRAELCLAEPRLWSPEDPWLYDVTVETADDRVETYFAIRTLDIRTVNGLPRLCLNGKPYFFHGVLDQGYWSDGLLTPASPACFADDIRAMKALGFNTLRKHLKVEPELFYYACDRLGMVVFQDMVNNGDYDIHRDLELPNSGLLRLDDRALHPEPDIRAEFLRAMELTVRTRGQHPCICCWTVFNEGWGQFDSQAQYERLRALDPTRPIDTTSGWFFCGQSDVESVHIYAMPVRVQPGDKPIVLSEFGGYASKVPGHSFNPYATYSYSLYPTQEAFRRALEDLYRKEVLPARDNGLCAAIYTQLSDVEDEVNGLVTYDRALCKADEARMREIAELLQF